MKAPLLLLITQSNHVEIIHRPEAFRVRSSFVLLRSPLYSEWEASLESPNHPAPFAVPHGGERQCFKAALGLANDRECVPCFAFGNHADFDPHPAESIVVATRSRLLPPSYATDVMGPLSLDDLSLPAMPDTLNDDTTWDDWGEEEFISLCEVRLDIGADRTSKRSQSCVYLLLTVSIALSTSPLPPLPTKSLSTPLDSEAMEVAEEQLPCSPQLSHLEFAYMRNNNDQAEDPSKPDDTDTNSLFEVDPQPSDDIPALRLFACFLDYGDCKSGLPRHDLTLTIPAHRYFCAALHLAPMDFEIGAARRARRCARGRHPHTMGTRLACLTGPQKLDELLEGATSLGFKGLLVRNRGDAAGSKDSARLSSLRWSRPGIRHSCSRPQGRSNRCLAATSTVRSDGPAKAVVLRFLFS